MAVDSQESKFLGTLPGPTAARRTQKCAKPVFTLQNFEGERAQQDCRDFPRPVKGDFTIAFDFRTSMSAGRARQWHDGFGMVDAEVTGPAKDFGISIGQGRVMFGIGRPDRTIISQRRFNDDQFHSVFATRSRNGDFSLFVDGILQGSRSGRSGPLDDSEFITVGCLQTKGRRNPFEGQIRSVQVFDEIVAPACISAGAGGGGGGGFPLLTFTPSDPVLTQFTLVAGVVIPTFILLIMHLCGKIGAINQKWAQNKAHRKERKTSSNMRMFFDSTRGAINEAALRNAKLVQTMESIHSMLRSLTVGGAFVNPTVHKHHPSLKQAKDAADECHEVVRNFLRQPNADVTLLSSADETHKVLLEMFERRPLTSDPTAVLNAYRDQVGTLKAVYGDKTVYGVGVPSCGVGVPSCGVGLPNLFKSKGATPKLARAMTGNQEPPDFKPAQPLEPAQPIPTISIKKGLSSSVIEWRDKYGIGSTRALIGMMAVLLVGGPVRFMGHFIAFVFCVCVLLHLTFELSCFSTQASLLGKWKSLQQSWFRLLFPVLLAAVAWAVTRGGHLAVPTTVGELQEIGTFLPVPPQYVEGVNEKQRIGELGVADDAVLVEVDGIRSFYIAVIFGIMHGNLLVLCLLPLPVCYALQAELVAFSPRLRCFVPKDPVWLHRTLGYILLFGLAFTAVWWVAFQGFGCFVLEAGAGPRCDAFNPLAQVGVDVFVLRFHIVWPLTFFFVPLMVYSKCPEGSSDSKHSKMPRRSPLREPAKASNQPSAELATKRRGCHQLKQDCQLITHWIRQRVTEVLMLCMAISGTIIAVLGSGTSPFVPFFFPAWPFILMMIVLHLCMKLKAFVFSRYSGGRNGWAERLQQIWWELAYSSHVVGFSVSVFFALLIRFDVFWPALFTWGLYFLDRLIGCIRASCCKTEILVGNGKSSFAIDTGKGENPEPSYVRLVVKKPDGFHYKAGQWVQVSVCQFGRQQWHPFSLASAEHEDELEFHIAVSAGKAGLIQNGEKVLVNEVDDAFCRLSRKKSWWERVFPHRVPVFGKIAESRSCCSGIQYEASTAGIYLQLAASGASGVKTLQPQVQWTGRLWNLVQSMLHIHGQRGSAPEQCIRLMGPYGTMPYTCDAHQAVMLIGGGVGFPSMGAMLRQLLYYNLGLPEERKKSVCFMWTASKVDQLLLCFPSLLVDLTMYVHQKSLQDLKSWLTIKIFISSFDAEDFMSVNPGPRLFPDSKKMEPSLAMVREWILGKDGMGDEDGTYIAQGSLGASFGDILRCSTFTRSEVIEKKRSLGICVCGPKDLCSWIRHEAARTTLPVPVEFNCEATSG